MMFKRNLTIFKNTFMNKRFYSNKNKYDDLRCNSVFPKESNRVDYYVFNLNTNKYERNMNYELNYLSPLECFIYYPFSYTKTFFNILFSKK